MPGFSSHGPTSPYSRTMSNALPLTPPTGLSLAAGLRLIPIGRSGLAFAFALGLVVAAGIAPGAAQAQFDEDQTDAARAETSTDKLIGDVFKAPRERQVKVVQKRLYTKSGKHQLTPFFGIDPSDSLMFNMMGGLRYFYYPVEYFAIQLNGAYAFGFEKDLAKRIKKDLTARERNIIDAKLQAYANIDLAFYPLYGKFSLMSDAIGSYDLGLYVGGGIMKFEKLSNIYPAFDAGIGGNVYFNTWLSLRWDVTYFLTVADSTLIDLKETKQSGTQLRQSVFLSLGLGFLLPVD